MMFECFSVLYPSNAQLLVTFGINGIKTRLIGYPKSIYDCSCFISLQYLCCRVHRLYQVCIHLCFVWLKIFSDH